MLQLSLTEEQVQSLANQLDIERQRRVSLEAQLKRDAQAAQVTRATLSRAEMREQKLLRDLDRNAHALSELRRHLDMLRVLLTITIAILLCHASSLSLSLTHTGWLALKSASTS